MPQPDLRLNKRLVFFATFAVALTLRVIFVFQWNDTPYGAMPLLDAKVYDDWAQAIAHGQLLRPRAFYASPLYSYLLGGLYALFGHSLLLAGLFNAVLSALTAAVLGLLAFSLFGLEAAALTGFLAAGYLPLIFYTAPVMKEPLGLLLMTLFLVVALRALKQNRMRDAFWGGVLIGLSALVRGNAILLAPVLLLMGFFKWRLAFFRSAAVFVAAMLICIAPATIHNFIVAREFIPINYADGFNLYIGNSPIANGTNEYPPEISSDPVQEEIATIWEAREAKGENVGPAEVSAYWRGRAMDFIIHNPERDLVLLKNKTLAFWNNLETFDSYDIDFISKNFDTLISLPLVALWLIVALAAFGAVAAWRERREDVTAIGILGFTYMLSVLIFYVTDRYRLPIVLFLLPLAGAAWPYGVRLVQKKTWPRLMVATALALAFLILCIRTPSDKVDYTAFDWGTLSTIYSDIGQDQETLDAMHKAIAISPGDAGSQAFVRGSMVEQSRGRIEEAERLLKIAMDFYPQDGVVYYNYGRLKAARGDLHNALAAFKKAADLTPTFTLTYYGLARVYEALGYHAWAVSSAEQGLRVDPSDARLQDILSHMKQR